MPADRTETVTGAGGAAAPSGNDDRPAGSLAARALAVAWRTRGAGDSGAPRRRSRRFPVITRDTARPEGGGRAASGDLPAPARQWPLLTVLGLTVLGLLVTLLEFRTGTLLVGVAMLVGAALRWRLPSVGMLAVRSRFTDLLTYGVLGAAIVLLALMAQPKPLVEIPFLGSLLHFSVR
ncbi:DUF3017 domain-containing protein [Streptomyces sp. NPDC005438]|uniref:DUF3017 domain-containing protein n=1 Tax=Streptomyces sp. NPDC005438 TaxID=3156880 RepID=UPI0033B654BC